MKQARALAVLAVAAVLVAACEAAPPDRHDRVQRVTEEVRAMPGVTAANSDLASNTAQGLVHFWLDVAVAEDITGDQVAAISTRYLDELGAVDYTAYDTELEVHAGANVFAVDSGHQGVTNGKQIADQARSWVALRHKLPSATTTFHASIVHLPLASAADRGGPIGLPPPVPDTGHANIATVELADTSDYNTVAQTIAMLATDFPELNRGAWTVTAGKSHPADIITSGRMPSPDEMRLWDALNADQSIAHVDAMHINAGGNPPLWIAEKTQSRDPAVAVALAGRHLPTVARLPGPVLYTANDNLQGKRNFYGLSTGPVAITVGGCTARTYRPDPTEQALINTYEKCPRGVATG